MKFIQFCARAYRGFVKAASCLQSPLLLLLRIYFGWQLAQNGWGKLHNLYGEEGVIEYFRSLGIPFPSLNAHFIGCLECGGGVLLMLGLATRPLALAFVISMSVAYYTADNEALHLFWKDPDKFMAAAPFPILYTALVLLAFGAGVFSLDWLIGKFVGKKLLAHPARP